MKQLRLFKIISGGGNDCFEDFFRIFAPRINQLSNSQIYETKNLYDVLAPFVRSNHGAIADGRNAESGGE